MVWWVPRGQGSSLSSQVNRAIVSPGRSIPPLGAKITNASEFKAVMIRNKTLLEGNIWWIVNRTSLISIPWLSNPCFLAIGESAHIVYLFSIYATLCERALQPHKLLDLNELSSTTFSPLSWLARWYCLWVVGCMILSVNPVGISSSPHFWCIIPTGQT